MRAAGLPYRRIAIATGDLSFVAAIKYDIEVWAAGSGRWLEVSSCSLFPRLRARRASIRYRPEERRARVRLHAQRLRPAAAAHHHRHPENYQQADGTVIVPEVRPTWAAWRSSAPAA
ncbi:MAG: hypothetical protein R2854_10830 [Caldilineaceae bacterium]